MSKATDRQKNIYISGMSGRRPLIPTDTNKLRQHARERLTAEAYAYIAGGAGMEDTIATNRSDFDKWKIVPRMLRDVSQRDTSLTLFGQSLPSPFLLAPIGVLEMAHNKADRAVAQAAKNTQTPMIFSNQASISMESCARVLEDSPHWFQLYWSKSDDLVASLVKRAEGCGCSALFKLAWRFPGRFATNLTSGVPLKSIRKFIEIYSRPSLSRRQTSRWSHQHHRSPTRHSQSHQRSNSHSNG